MGVVLLMGVSCVLEWSCFYVVEFCFLGYVGGLVGYVFGLLGMKGLGFVGFGVVWIVLLLIGMVWVLCFLWGYVVEFIGECIE